MDQGSDQRFRCNQRDRAIGGSEDRVRLSAGRWIGWEMDGQDMIGGSQSEHDAINRGVHDACCECDKRRGLKHLVLAPGHMWGSG